MRAAQVIDRLQQLEGRMPSIGAALGMTLVSVLLWGFSPIATRYMVGTGDGGLPPAAFMGLCYGTAAVVLSPALLLTRSWTSRDWLVGAVCGVIGITGYNFPAAIGQQTVSAGLTGLLDASEPLLILVFASIALRKAPTLLMVFSVLAGLFGVALLAHGAGPAFGTPRGIILVLTGAGLWSLYCVLVTPLINRRGALPTTAVTVSFGALPMVLSGAPKIPGMVVSMSTAQWLVTFAFIGGNAVAAMLFWNAGSAVLGAQRAGWFLYLLPLVSLLGGAALLAEPLSWIELLGGALILLAVFLAHLEAKPPR